MSLATTIGAGTLLGGILAVGVYSALAPADTVSASVPAAPTYAPVPTRTVSVESEDCVGKAVLVGDECVLHVPGPTVTIPAATTARAEESHSSSGTTTTSAPPRTAGPATTTTAGSDDGYAEQEDGEDESHEDGEHEEDHEDEYDGGGEYEHD